MKGKSFITLTPVVNIIKLFFFVADKEAKRARAFVPDKPFQPDLIFAGRLLDLFAREERLANDKRSSLKGRFVSNE
jgi:hypothetical protein